MALSLMQQLIAYLDSLGFDVTQQNLNASGIKVGTSTNQSPITNTSLKTAVNTSNTSGTGTGTTQQSASQSPLASLGTVASTGMGLSQLLMGRSQSKANELAMKTQSQNQAATILSSKDQVAAQATQGQLAQAHQAALTANQTLGQEKLQLISETRSNTDLYNHIDDLNALKARLQNGEIIKDQNGNQITIDSVNKQIGRASEDASASDDMIEQLNSNIDNNTGIIDTANSTIVRLGGTPDVPSPSYDNAGLPLPSTTDPSVAIVAQNTFAETGDPDLAIAAGMRQQAIVDAQPALTTEQTTISDLIPEVPAPAPFVLTPSDLHWTMGNLIGVGVAIGSAYGLFASVKSLMDHFSITGLLGSAGTTVSLWLSLSKMHDLFMNTIFHNGLFNSMPSLQHLMAFLTSGPGIAIIIAAIVLLAFLLNMIVPNKTPAPAELPLAAPTVWASGSAVYFIGAGAVLATVGIMMGPTAPLTQSVTAPMTTLTSAFNSSQLTDSDGNAVGALTSVVGPVFVDQGSGAGDPTHVVYVTQGSNGTGVANVETLAANMRFAAAKSPTDITIPFFLNNSINPMAVKAVASTDANMQAGTALSNSAGSTAVKLGAAANKDTTVH